jgi:hypothetical protein
MWRVACTASLGSRAILGKVYFVSYAHLATKTGNLEYSAADFNRTVQYTPLAQGDHVTELICRQPSGIPF